ncbi:5,10-methylene-tetrahydrofolate dehydrogenase/methenyl tetrahydrofolate cyclohydrolase [Bacillus mesophilus]|nr:5,10-methylene-tetrahydrofolate dehydrogenase/methenyl tetrahydrofolate cyclohydrolase [Bacillus mesophilus]
MDLTKLKKQLYMGCTLLGILTVLGSIQTIFSPYPFVRGVSSMVVIGCSICIGAFIRELFIINRNI